MSYPFPAKSQLFQPIHPSSLGLFRILFGLVLMVQVYFIFNNDFIVDNFLANTLFIPHFLFSTLHIPIASKMVMPWIFFLMGLSSIGITFGFLTRLSLLTFLCTFSYIFFLESAIYNNHYYLFILITILLAINNNHYGWSVDQLMFPKKTSYVPYWQLFLLRFQVALVYIYGAIVKINYDWMVRAEPMSTRFSEDHIFLNMSIPDKWVAYGFSYAGFLLDLLLGLSLMRRSHLKWALMLAILFNTTNIYLFQSEIGIFPYFMLIAFILYLKPEQPQKILNHILGKAKDLTDFEPNAHQIRRPIGTYILIILYMGFQILFPLRHFFYPGKVNWNGQGYTFSWRMKLDIAKTNIKITCIDTKTNESLEYPFYNSDLTPLQRQKVGGQPYRLYVYSQYLKQHLQEQGLHSPIMNIEAQTSLNGRPPRPHIDPSYDLAKEKYPVFSTPKWIIPFDQ